MQLLASQELDAVAAKSPVDLKIEADGGTYSFLLSTQKGKWILLKDGIDGRFLSTRVAGGFVGCLYAVYATSLGMPSTSKAYFDWYEYSRNDEVYSSGR